jgi:protease-4
MLTMIADGREMEPSEVAAILDSGPFTADAALEAGLIDSLASPDALLALIEITAGEGFELTDAWDGDEEPAKPMGFMEIFQLFQPPARPAESPNPKIALIYASGPIIVSRADEGPFADPNVITSEEMIELLHECRDDDTVRAVVMRIDSPGGSAVASDMIWQEIVRLREIKPVVVSMGNIAASGGYYISMGATEIFAEPGTITGSIGVVTGKLALGGLLEGHLGITHDTISRGQNAGMFSSWSPFTDSEREAMRTLMEDIYDAFTTKAAESRGMDIDALRAVAEGRVWTGHQAQERGLVDTLGGLRTALDRAEALADFTGYDVRDVEILELPEPMNIMEWFAEYMAGEVAVTPPPPLAGALVASVLDLLSPTERALIGQVQLYQSLFNTEHTLTLMPVAFRVR